MVVYLNSTPGTKPGLGQRLRQVLLLPYCAKGVERRAEEGSLQQQGFLSGVLLGGNTAKRGSARCFCLHSQRASISTLCKAKHRWGLYRKEEGTQIEREIVRYLILSKVNCTRRT